MIGYLELGKEFDIITRHIHEALDVGIHVFVDNSLLASLPAPGSTDGAATSPLFEGQQRVFQVEPRLPPWFSEATVENRGALGGWAAARPYGDAPDTAVGVLPLRDASGAAVGDMVLVFDIEADVHAMRERNLVSGSALAGALVLLVLVAVSFARRLDRQVARTERVRAKLIGELEATIAERTADLRAEVAERERLEEARRRGERMEAIGQLTGGVAHEFNNLLQVVLGNLDLLLTRIEPGQSGHKFAAAARKAAMRGGELTQRLLSFWPPAIARAACRYAGRGHHGAYRSAPSDPARDRCRREPPIRRSLAGHGRCRAARGCDFSTWCSTLATPCPEAVPV